MMPSPMNESVEGEGDLRTAKYLAVLSQHDCSIGYASQNFRRRAFVRERTAGRNFTGSCQPPAPLDLPSRGIRRAQEWALRHF